MVREENPMIALEASPPIKTPTTLNATVIPPRNIAVGWTIGQGTPRKVQQCIVHLLLFLALALTYRRRSYPAQPSEGFMSAEVDSKPNVEF